MTITVEGVRCRWCGRAFEVTPGPGRPRLYCRRSCRQRDYEARRRATELALGDDELVITRAELDELRDRLYVLSCAVSDVERDLAASSEPADVKSALTWLLDAAHQALGQ